jgi:exopolysaccharide biosynthesis protein
MLSRRLLLFLCALAVCPAADVVEQPFRGITHITRTESSPRNLHIHILKIDLTEPGLRFHLSRAAGSRETVRQTTLEFLEQEHAQVAINVHFFLPFPSTDRESWLVGFAASDGDVYSAFETPSQSYALVRDAPALNVDRENHASIVHRDAAFEDGKHVMEKVTIWNAVAGSGQILTRGVETIPRYDDALRAGGPNSYSNEKSWYDVRTARAAIGVSEDGGTLFLFTVDVRGGSEGMEVGEVASMLRREGAYDALNLDGGGSTRLAMEDPETHARRIVNVSSDNPMGRSVASSLAVFAEAAR